MRVPVRGVIVARNGGCFHLEADEVRVPGDSRRAIQAYRLRLPCRLAAASSRNKP